MIGPGSDKKRGGGGSNACSKRYCRIPNGLSIWTKGPDAAKFIVKIVTQHNHRTLSPWLPWFLLSSSSAVVIFTFQCQLSNFAYVTSHVRHSSIIFCSFATFSFHLHLSSGLHKSLDVLQSWKNDIHWTGNATAIPCYKQYILGLDEPEEVLMQKIQKFCADFEYVNLKLRFWEKSFFLISWIQKCALTWSNWPEIWPKLAALFSFPSAEFVSAGTPFWSIGAVGSWRGRRGKKVQSPKPESQALFSFPSAQFVKCQIKRFVCHSLACSFKLFSLSSLASSVCMRKYFPGLPQLKHTLLKVSSEERWRVIRVFHLSELLCQFVCKKWEGFTLFLTNEGW